MAEREVPAKPAIALRINQNAVGRERTRLAGRGSSVWKSKEEENLASGYCITTGRGMKLGHKQGPGLEEPMKPGQGVCS